MCSIQWEWKMPAVYKNGNLSTRVLMGAYVQFTKPVKQQSQFMLSFEMDICECHRAHRLETQSTWLRNSVQVWDDEKFLMR